ncbi:exopolysaccharide biosynthesis glycosyltransferase EpsD [Candidatus Oscillochloris fontis]|uniref:exopolysaccharide biosynthesis glycosyltransferase EpsD n=1 Tax=Candidatus Oscillochloris fontis TaxID=2496868 RepID=UPI00101D607D|nr:exopolysaccharide biosynthesis glycosyltransferase EpsD [Candidatus Oscillochloris fontis]
MPALSIVIPTYNRLPRLKQVIAALEGQTYPMTDVEVIVVSDGSTDGTHEYLRDLTTRLNLCFVPQANAGPAAARNNGIRNAHGEIIIFVDDDVVPSPDLVAEHMRLHAGHTNRVVLGTMLNPPDFTFSPWVAWEQAMLMKQYDAMHRGDWPATARQFYTGNTSLPRQLLLTSGGFDERFRRAEDIELAYRLERQGVEFIFCMQAVGYHYAERSFSSWIQIPYTYGRYEVLFSHEQQSALLDFILEEFEDRNRFTRMIIALCMDRPRLSTQVQEVIRWVADRGYQIGKLGQHLSKIGYSAIFNLRYYQGVADALGGRQAFYGGAVGVMNRRG